RTFCGYAGAALRPRMGVGQAGVDFLDALDRQNVARGLASELVGAVAGTDGNRQGIELRATHEISGLFGVGEQLVAGHGAFGAVPVFLVAHHRFERTQTTKLPFDRHAQLVGHFDHTAGDFDVVFVIGNGLAVFHQRTVHHDAGETQVDGALADGGRLTVVLVHDHGNVGVGLDGGL